MTFCDAYSKHRESHYARPCFPEINLIDHNWLKLPNDKILNRLRLKMPFYNLAGKFVSRFLLTGAICAQLAEKPAILQWTLPIVSNQIMQQSYELVENTDPPKSKKTIFSPKNMKIISILALLK